MSKITLIINREYTTRIRKKSFLIMSILGPFIFAAYVLIPMYFATLEDKEEKTVVVIDDSSFLQNTEQRVLHFRCTRNRIPEIPGRWRGSLLKLSGQGFDVSGYYAVIVYPFQYPGL